MFFSWLRNRRRRKLLAEPFPLRWERFLLENVAHAARLSSTEQARLRDAVVVLVAEKVWEGGPGLFVTEEMKVTIAAQAALLLLGDTHDYFARVDSVVIFPTTFRNPVREDIWDDELLAEGERDGETGHRGPVILSWDNVLHEARHPAEGYNLVLHEFAHQLDLLDGELNGTPDLPDREAHTRWKYVMSVAFRDHRRAIDRYEKGGEVPFFSDQAAETEDEFFADATEAFYCTPHAFRDEFPAVYELFAAYYKVDPTRWFPESS